MRKKALFLTVNPPKPSTKQRILDSLDYLAEKGFDCTVMPVPNGLPGRLGMFARLGRYDVVCVQKKLMSPIEIRLMRLMNPRLVYDLDDSVMFHEVERGEPLTGKYFKRFVTMAGCARAVMAGNSFLYEFARHNNPNVRIVPTPVDVSRYTPRERAEADGTVVAGWIGTRGNLRYLEPLAPVFRRLSERYPNFALMVICSDFPEMEGVKIIKRKWSDESEVADLRDMDIGVMPLADNIWTRGKCGFKILQYFAVGIPAVASPVGVNREIIGHGTDGFLADTEDEWFTCMARLIEDTQLRKEMGKRGREKVIGKYSRQAHNARLIEVLELI